MRHRGITFIGFCILSTLITFCSSTPGLKSDGISISVDRSQLETRREPIPPGMGITDRELEQLNRFVLSSDPFREVIPLVSRCKKDPQDHPFCFTILSREMLEKKRRQLHSRKTSSHKFGFGSGRPIIREGKVLNWPSIKQASVNSMIKSFSHLSIDKLMVIKQHAMAETSCPNNPAISIAATLEDLLPNNVDALEIAALYEKGGNCIPQAPAEQEILFTRAGLFYFLKKDFKQAIRVFEKAKGVDVSYIGRPLYWLSRCYLELGEKKEAKKIVDFLRNRYPFSFHTIVALTSEKVDAGDILKSQSGSGSSRRSQQNPNVNTLIDQVELLKRFGYSAAASRVLDWAAAESQGFEPEVRLYLAELKQDGPDRVSQIFLLSDILYKNPQLVSKQSMDLYFPKVFYPVFETNIAGLDPNLLLAVARQESAFNPRARSIANARGLLQILPRTGRRFKKRLNLYDPAMNVEVGSRYLYELLKRLNGNIPLALASYNAGPERVSKWATRYPVDNPVLFTDLIPFRETREYVASILRNYYWYRRMNSADDETFVDLVYETSLTDRTVTAKPENK